MKHISQAVDAHREEILQAERYIWKHPETGYKEVKTSRYMEEAFRRLGYDLVMAEGITGFTTTLDTGKEGPTVLILGELDSIVCATHPEADPETGASHSCGHNAQCAALLGIAAALKEPGMLDRLCGKIMLCAVPAEELVEIDYRRQLREKGIIRYFGGKGEFYARGMFEGVDLAFMVHTSSNFSVRGGSIGCIAKTVVYKGKASHAGGSPWNGCNALYAANCGLNAANALRETFKEADCIRFHPIITHGGDIVNAIPERVVIESYVRGGSFPAILNASKKINRALAGAALSMGANVEIVDLPGYSPLKNDTNMMDLCEDAFHQMFPDKTFSRSSIVGTGCTDMGDLSTVMPVVHPYAGGAGGTSHGSDYQIKNPEDACVNSAKWQLAMLEMLLENGAERAKKIISEYTPLFASREEYMDFMDKLNGEGDRIEYLEDGNCTVRLN